MDMETTLESPQTVTQEDLDFLNGLRLGFLPILSMDRQANRRSAEAWTTGFIQGQLSNPAIVDVPDAVAYLQVFADKLLILAVEVRRFTAILQSKLTLEQAATLKAAMTEENRLKDRARILEAQKQRDELANKPKGSPLRLTDEEKAAKGIIKACSVLTQVEVRNMINQMFPSFTDSSFEKVWKAVKG